ncbi:MAG: TonB-dependent receptor plug domain-containing protein [Bacteroidia bacterium]
MYLYKLIFLSTLSFLLTIQLKSQTDTTSLLVPEKDSTENKYRLPIFSTTAEDVDAELESQDISGLLQSSRDVYTATAGFNFGSARFRIRGYGSANTVVMINGVKVNDLESGFATWSNWGGLNDVTRFMEVRTGVSASRINFGDIGGYSNIDTRASSLRKGTRFSYALSNRTYTHRLMLTHATGMMENGWAVAASISRRWANEGYVEGTYFDAWSYFLALEKRINESQSLNFTVFGAPIEQGRQGLAVQEAYDLAGDNFYNPFWGYQAGKKRNARVSNNHRPMFMLTHNWKISEKTKLNTSGYYTFGESGLTNLNWYDAKDPRPDYYRYLPSYFSLRGEEEKYQEALNNWKNDVNTRQINWDALYNANMKNLYTAQNVDGIAGNNVTGNRSKYILEQNVNSIQLMGINAISHTKINDKFNVSAGLNYTHSKNNYFKRMHDLLGGDFWIDIDQFSERDFNDINVAQNDLDNPNRLIRKGDKFGYDYDINVNKAEAFTQVEYQLRRWEFYLGAQLSHTTFWRTGNLRNGRFPEESLGDSEKKNFTNYGVKGGVVFKISGRHYLTTNALLMTKAPLPRTVFLSPRNRNLIVPNLQSEEIKSADINYIIRYARLRTRATLYYTEINNQVWNRSFYHDDFRTLVNYTMTGVNHLYTGAEFGMDLTISPSFNLTSAFGTGQFVFNSRPTATITRDNAAELLAENRTVYFKNYRIGGMPQTAATIGLKYSSSKYWFAGFNVNYFDDIYVEANPDRRTEEALEKYVVTDPQWQQALAQEKLPSQYTVDFYFGKSWKIKSYFINLNINVNNVLNNKEFRTGGFEQLRYDIDQLERFPPKYSYHFGRTFFAMLSLRF